jgi:hypothetical protein
MAFERLTSALRVAAFTARRGEGLRISSAQLCATLMLGSAKAPTANGRPVPRQVAHGHCQAIRQGQNICEVRRRRARPRCASDCQKAPSTLTLLKPQSLYAELAEVRLSARSIGDTDSVLHRVLAQRVKLNLLGNAKSILQNQEALADGRARESEGVQPEPSSNASTGANASTPATLFGSSQT